MWLCVSQTDNRRGRCIFWYDFRSFVLSHISRTEGRSIGREIRTARVWISRQPIRIQKIDGVEKETDQTAAATGDDGGSTRTSTKWWYRNCSHRTDRRGRINTADAGGIEHCIGTGWSRTKCNAQKEIKPVRSCDSTYIVSAVSKTQTLCFNSLSLSLCAVVRLIFLALSVSLFYCLSDIIYTHATRILLMLVAASTQKSRLSVSTCCPARCVPDSMIRSVETYKFNL